MNCPQCQGTRIEARRGVRRWLMRDATPYVLICGDCGTIWGAVRGWRGVPDGEEAPDEWANVTFVEKEEP